VLAHTIDGAAVEADSLDDVDLLAAVDDSVFARPGSFDAVVGPTRRTVLPLRPWGASLRAGRDRRRSAAALPRRHGRGVTVVSTALADTLHLAVGGAAGLVGLSEGVPAVGCSPRAPTRRLRAEGRAVLRARLAQLRERLGVAVDGILGFRRSTVTR